MSLGVYQDEHLITVETWKERVFIPLQNGSGGCSRTHERLNLIQAEREAKIKWWSCRAQGENLRHRAQWCPPGDSHPEHHSIRTQPSLKHKSLMEKAALPRFCFQELWGASCDLHGLTEQHNTAAALKGEGLCVLLSFPTWLPHACGAQAWQLPQPFPGWSCTVTSVPTLCWQQAPFPCLRAAPALSSFVRMKGSSQSCTVCFDNRAALFALLYQYMEKWGLVLYLRY